MRLLRIVGLLLIVGGIVALAMRHFSYTEATHKVQFGPLEMTVKETKDVELPTWGGVTAVAVGVVLVVVGGRRR